MGQLPYHQGLQDLRLMTLLERRMHGDLIKTLHLILPQVLEADLNFLLLQRGNLLMFYARRPLVLTVPRWMLDFPANGVNPRNLKIFEHVRFKLVAII